MSANTTKSREEILAERLEKKKRKAALKNQPKGKIQNVQGGNIRINPEGNSESVFCSSAAGENKPKTESQNEILTNYLESTESVTDDEKIRKTDNNFDKKLEIDVKKIHNESSNMENTAVKTKAQLKAERRAKQEADRAKKLEKTQSQTPVQEKKVMKSVMKPKEPEKALNVIKNGTGDLGHKVKLFAHLYNLGVNVDSVYRDGNQERIHPIIIQLGAQYLSKIVSGANACCLALLNAFKKVMATVCEVAETLESRNLYDYTNKVVMDFETAPNQEFSRGLEAEITKSMAYLSRCRPVAVSMVNAVKHLKYQVSQCKGNELECKNNISEWIDTYIKEQLEMAAKAICLFVREKIAPGDVILSYGCSSLIQQILTSVHNEGIHFQVIVVDGRPWLEGKEMLKRLVSAGIHCTYVFMNGLSFIMPEVTKILLGAHALLANGYVMSRAGSSQIALLAKAYNVPVLVCCETHKFSERVQTDAFVYNELGNPDDLASKKGCLSQELLKWKSIQFLTPLNLTYDVTPPDLVSAVVTEIAVLPCTSVPVILRIKPPDV